MKREIRRIIALFCALCLIVSGEGRLSLTALADVLRSIPAAEAVEGTDSTEGKNTNAAEDMADAGDEADYAEDAAAQAEAAGAEAAHAQAEAEGTNTEGTEAETVLSESVLTAEWDIYRIKVRYGKESGIPEDAQLVVREITEQNSPAIGDYISTGAETAGVDVETADIAKAFDISLRSNETGEEYQPSSDMKVEISIPSYYMKDTMQVDVVHFAEKHDETAGETVEETAEEAVEETLPEDRAGEDADVQESVAADTLKPVIDTTPKLMDVNLVNNTAAFTTDGFSVFVVLGYTVDFHWGEYTYTMEGDSTILLSEMLSAVIDNSAYGVSHGLSEDDILRLEGILDDPAAIDLVEFSNHTLMDIKKVDTETARDILKARTEEDRLAIEREVESGELEAGEENHDASWESYNMAEDWALTSLRSFKTEEKLTIRLKGGAVIDILVTDPVSFNYQGLTYQVQNVRINGVMTEALRVAGYTSGYTGIPTIPKEITYEGITYPVYDLTYFGTRATLQNKHIFFENEMLDKMADGAVIGMPQMVAGVDAAVEESLLANGFMPGSANGSSDQYVWKKAVYNPETNSITYEIKYFHPMKQQQPLDFIFGIDQSGTMCTHDATANGVRAPRVIWMMAMLQRTAYELVSKNGTGPDQGYDNKVALVPWGSSDITPVTTADFLSTSEQIDAWFRSPATYAHAAEGTNHGKTCNALADAAELSIRNGRTPIVIYMSDFVSHAGSTATQRNRLKNAPYKTYSFVVFNNGHTEFSKGWTNSGAYEADDPALFMGIFRDIVLDAIGYYIKNPVAVTDTMPDAIHDAVATQTDAGGTAASNPGTVNSSPGKVEWNVGNQNPLLESGKYHTEVFTARLDDDTIYSGAMPTNGSVTVTKDGHDVNTITPDENQPDKLHKGGDVAFLLGRLDKKNQVTASTEGVPTKLTGGIQFTLTRMGETETIKTTEAPDGIFTTDAGGSFSVPFKDTNGRVIFGLGESFLLHEVGDSVVAYNADTNHDEKLVAPDMDWIIDVASNGIITMRPQDGASQTPNTTIAKAVSPNPARIVLWNQIVVPATLIPVTIQKTWQDNSRPHDPVPFTIYGVPQGMPYEERPLTAYTEKNVSSAQVKYLDPNSVKCVESGNGLVWTQTVYVPDKEVDGGIEYKYFSYDVMSALENHNYHYSDGTLMPTGALTQYDAADGTADGVITYNQTYSYVIREGEMAYPDGWFTPTYSNNVNPDLLNNSLETIHEPFSLVAYDNGTGSTIIPSQTVTNGNGNLDGISMTPFQFHMNASTLAYKDNEMTGAEYHTAFGITAGSNLDIDHAAELEAFYEHIGTMKIEFTRGGKKYVLAFSPIHDEGENVYQHDHHDIAGVARHDGFTFRNIYLPSDWATPTTEVKRELNLEESFYRLNDITITKITATSNVDATKSVVMYSSEGETSNTWIYNPTYSDTMVYNRRNYAGGHAAEFELREGREDYHRHSTRYSSQSLTRKEYSSPGSDPKPLEDTQFNRSNITIRGALTLGITNDWNPNELIQMDITKNWVSDDEQKLKEAIERQLVTDSADPDNGKYRITFTMSGSTERGGTKTVPLFDSEDDEWSAGYETGAITETDSTKTTWEKTVYVPTYDVSTYRRTVKDDYTEEEDVQPYTYDNTSFHEAPLDIGTDDDGRPRGNWSTPSANLEMTPIEVTPPPAEPDPPTPADPETPPGYVEYTGPIRRMVLEFMLSSPPNIDDVKKITMVYRYQKDGKTVQNMVVLERNVPIHMQDFVSDQLVFNGPYTNFQHLHPRDFVSLEIVTFQGRTYSFGTNQIVARFDVFDLYQGSGTATDGIIIKSYTLDASEGDGSGSGTGSGSGAGSGSGTGSGAGTGSGTNPAPTKMKGDLTITNTFTPYKEIKLSSEFSDISDDSESTDLIKNVSYVIRQNGTIVRETTPIASSISNGSGNTGIRTIYLPEGDYAITQRYILDGDSTGYELDGDQDAYTVTWSETEENTNGDLRYDRNINGDRVISFTNGRKNLPIHVQMEWDPTLLSSEDPLKENDKILNYALRYNKADGSTPISIGSGIYTKTVDGGTPASQPDGTPFQFEYARQVNSHATGIPSYSVREAKTECTMDRKNMEDALPEYALEVFSEERADALVFTIKASIIRTDIRISKEWVEVGDNYAYPSSLTYTLKRSDGRNIYGTNEAVLSVTVNNPGAPAAWSVDEAIFNDVPILRSKGVDASVKYILTESDSGKSYYTGYVDLTDMSANQFVQDTSADEEYASFRLNDGGIFIRVENAKDPFICKIVETFEGTDDVIEHPFRSLRSAQDWARRNMDMDKTHAVTIQMLVDYSVPSTDTLELKEYSVTVETITKSGIDNITLTTAATSGGKYNYVNTLSDKAAADKDTAVLTRTHDHSLFNLQNKDAKLAFEDIILESNHSTGDTGTNVANGGFVNITKGTLNLNDGATLRNSKASYGGAVYMFGAANETCEMYMAEGSKIENCKAVDGGAVYINSPTADSSAKFVMDGGSIERCTVSNWGGAVYMSALVANSAVTFTMNDGSIDQCMADTMGGAVHMRAPAVNSAATFTVNGGTINQCSAVTRGGVVYTYAIANADSSFIMNEGTIQNCKTTDAAGEGGVVYLENSGSRFTMNGGLIDDCEAYNGGVVGSVCAGDVNHPIEFNLNGGTIQNCSAKNWGGVANVHNYMHFNMTGGTIKGCKAGTTAGNGTGGVVYLFAAGSRFDMSGGLIEKCSAGTSGVVHIADCGTMAMSGGAIKDNKTTRNNTSTAAGTAGVGAVEIANCGAKIELSGNPVIYNNLDKDNKQANIRLNHDAANVDQRVIRVVGNGLTDGAKIGVWPTYANNQDYGEQFAVSTQAASKASLSGFRNDYHSDHSGTGMELFGYPSTEVSMLPSHEGYDYRYKVIWKYIICKIVHTESGAVVETVFSTLNDAVKYARDNKTALGMSASNPVKVQMLVDYVIPADDVVNLNQSGDNIIFTTAAIESKLPAGEHIPFKATFGSTDGRLVDDDPEKSILMRGFNADTGDKSLFTVGSPSSVLGFETIILDGASGRYTANTNGGIVKVAANVVNVGNGTVMRNTKVTNSVLAASGNATSDVEAGCGGAIYASRGASVNITETLTGEDPGVVFSNCEATFGGAIHVKGPAAEGSGGGLSVSATTQGKAITVTRNGEDYSETIQVGGVKFENCQAYKSGGAIYHGYYTGRLNNQVVHPARTYIDGCYFDKCYAWTLNIPEAYGGGGAINTYAYVLNVSDSYFGMCEVKAPGLDSNSVRGSHIGGGQGGAIYHIPDTVQAGTSSATLTDSYFTGCTSKSSGGTIESNALLFTISGCIFDETITNNGANGGAISSYFGKQREKNEATGEVFFAFDTTKANAKMIVESCKFYQCYSVTKAESVIPNASDSEDEVYHGGNGGAIRSSSNRLEVKDCEFNDCHAFHGGAIFTTDRTEYVKIYGNTRFEDCYTPHSGTDVDSGKAGNGGAIYLNKKSGTNNTYEIIGVTFEGVADHHMNSQGMDAVRGGAIYLKGGNLRLDGTTFHDCRATLNGGAVYMDEGTTEGTTLDIGGSRNYFWECAANAEMTDNDGKGNGGAIYCKSSATNSATGATLKIVNAEFNGHKKHENESLIHLHDDVPNAVDGGAIYMKAGTLMVDGSANPVSIMNCTVGNGIMDSENPIINSGGAIFLREKTMATLASTVIDGHSTTTENGRSVTYGSQYANAAYGGGIYAVSGSTVSMTNGGVTGSTASADGAGIYLEEGARLNLSGGLNFGGTDLVGGSGGSRDDLKGTDGNFVLKGSSFKAGSDEPLNGAKDYPKDDGENYKVRQDIYIKGYIGKTGDNPTPATSLNVAGALTDPADSSKPAPEGSIWVWAEVPAAADENNHYEQFKQFATFSSGLGAAVMEDSVKAFRDSVDDERSQNGTDSYLTGTLDGDLTGNYIYWYGNNGYRKVILRKADRADFEPLENAEFDIYRGNGQSPYVVKDRVDKSITDELRDEISKGSGVIWIGTLPYGVYYLHEKIVPSGYVGSGTSEGRWFYMVVGDDPTTMSRGYESRNAAKTAYENEKKSQGNP